MKNIYSLKDYEFYFIILILFLCLFYKNVCYFYKKQKFI